MGIIIRFFAAIILAFVLYMIIGVTLTIMGISGNGGLEVGFLSGLLGAFILYLIHVWRWGSDD